MDSFLETGTPPPPGSGILLFLHDLFSPDAKGSSENPISQVLFFIISFPKNNPEEVLITPFKNLLKLLGRAGPSPLCWFAASPQRDGGASFSYQKKLLQHTN